MAHFMGVGLVLVLEGTPLKEGISNCSVLFWGQQEDVCLLKKETGQDSFFKKKMLDLNSERKTKMREM